MTSPTIVLDDLLRAAVERGASDIHVKVPSKPVLRANGRLQRLEEFPAAMPAATEDLLAEMLATLPHAAKQVEFDRTGEVDFAYSHPGLGRFRVNAYRQRGSVTVVFRLVAFGVPQLADLGLPEIVPQLAGHSDGLVVIGGRQGSGVTTTLAALVDLMNHTSDRNIISIEDPIEILHHDDRCVVNQREVGLDVASVAEGLGRALRHDPDVLVIANIADAETAEAALNAAQSGILVLAGMPTQGVPDTMGRLIGLYPLPQQPLARAAVASCLRGIVCQRLVPRADGAGRRVATEILIGTPDARDAIARGAGGADLLALIAAGGTDGMRTLDASLRDLVVAGEVDPSYAARESRDPALVRDHMALAGT